MFKIEGPQIVSESSSADGTWDDFVNSLPPNECRYAVYDMDFTTNDGRSGNKIVMVAWFVLYDDLDLFNSL